MPSGDLEAGKEDEEEDAEEGVDAFEDRLVEEKQQLRRSSQRTLAPMNKSKSATANYRNRK